MKKQLLDPLGSLCKLVALNFSGVHTKISIQNHVLTLQRPNNYQFLIRFYNGDGRENVSELYYVIIRILKWYILPTVLPEIAPNSYDEYDSEDDNNNINIQSSSETHSYDSTNASEISNSEVFKKMIRYLCSGFRKLQETYEFGNVVLSLQFYINLLEDGIAGRFDNNKLPKYILEKDKEYENLLDYNKLKNLWDVKKLERICSLYDQCFQTYAEGGTSEKRDATIEAYLRSIDSFLDDFDGDFQKLIQNSNKG
jgi:hypothetical protein